VRLAGTVFGDNRKDDFTRVKKFQARGAGYKLAVGREDGRNADQVLSSDASVPQGEFEGSETFPMFTDPLGEENPLGDHVLAQFICLQKFARVGENANLT